MEVVEQGLEVVLGGEAGVEQEALDAGPFSEASIVEHLQVVLNTPSLYRQEKTIIPPQIYPFLPTSARKQAKQSRNSMSHEFILYHKTA